MINVAIYGWPFLATAIFASLRDRRAILIAVLVGYLMLPARGGLDLPVLPAFDKAFLASMLPLILAFSLLPVDRRTDLPGLLPRSAVVWILLAVLVVGTMITALTNGDPIRYEIRFLSGLTLYDAFSDIMEAMIFLGPFFLGRKFFGHPDNHAILLKVIVVAGLGYSVLALYEVRMSPQLSNMVYGFFPHSFHQHFRNGGWRPIVFLSHGLFVALFFAMTLMAALTLWRASRGETGRGRYLFATIWLFLTLLACKSLGSMILATLGGVFLIFFRPRTQILGMAVLSGVVLIYPSLRAMDVVPTEAILARAAALDPARAESLAFRFRSENILLEKAREKPIFGWGKRGRSRAYTEDGRDIAVPDGIWVIQFGIGGWARYLPLFGLLTYGLIAVAFKSWPVSPMTAGLAVVLGVNLLDLLPNSGIMPLTWLLSGAFLGRLEWGRITEDTSVDPEQDPPPDTGPGRRYSRQTKIHHRSRTNTKGRSYARSTE